MFSIKIITNFIRKELPEATVISRRTQIIKRTPFDIPRRRDDYKMNYAELQLWLSCVHGRYDQNMRHTTRSQNVNKVFLRPENVAWKVEIFRLPCDMCTKQQSDPFMRIYIFSAYFFPSCMCKRVFTHADLCVTFPFNPNFIAIVIQPQNSNRRFVRQYLFPRFINTIIISRIQVRNKCTTIVKNIQQVNMCSGCPIYFTTLLAQKSEKK